ncbi:hypothetical protein MKW92_000462 [Papaver armeniacum]|nr:hypothetical protein MKW92_000462 [Papaver armeniacum]
MAYESGLVCLFAIQFFVLFSAMEVGAKISAVIVFGDSTVDAGNNNHMLTIVKCNYRPYGQDFEGGKPSGRWSNGRLFTDFISDALGIKPSIPAYLDTNFGIEDFSTGVTFASGGAGYDNLTTTLVNAIPLWKQLEFFKEYQEKLTKFQGKEKAAETIHEALYIKFLAKNAGEFIKDLYGLGARKIALGGSVPMGCLPFSRTLNVLLGRTCVDGYNKVGTDFNLHLIKLIEDLRKEIDGIRLVYADAYIPLSKMMQTPSLYAVEVGAKVSAVIGFGDSTIDAGNNNLNLAIFKCNFKPYGQNFKGGKPTGRWSNGRVFTDFISDALGIKPSIPAYLDTNFRGAIPLWKQLEFFKEYKEKLTNFQGEEKATKTIREALYIISIGTNDFILNYLTVPIRPLQLNMENFQIFLAENAGKFIKDLHNLGARKIALGGSIPMGCLPFARNLNVLVGRPCVDLYNKVARDFNIKLFKLVGELRKEIDEIKLVYADGYTPLAQMVQTPSLYGFEEVKNGCCGTGKFEVDQLCTLEMALLCKDPTKYMYWDAIHLTDTANGLLADSLLKTSLAELI